MGYFSTPSYNPGSFSGWQAPRYAAGSVSTPTPPQPFVEKPDVNSLFGQGMNVVAAAGRAPAYMAERPLAWLNTATADPATGQGFVGDALGAIRGIPFLGPALGTAADLLAKASSIPATILNSGTASALAATNGAPDSTPLPAGPGATAQTFLYSMPIIGQVLSIADFVNGAQIRTVGDLRRYAYGLGFTPQDTADLAAGKRDIFSFGDKSVHQNEVINAVVQLGLDPTNLAFGLGVAGKLPKLSDGVGMVGRFFGALGTRVPLAHEAWTASSDLVRNANLVNYAGFAHTVAGLTRGAVRVNNAAGIGLTAAELTLNAVSPMSPDNTPRNGLLEQLADFSRRASRDQPLSNNNLFTLYAAFKFPFRRAVSDIRGNFQQAHFKASGSNILPSAVDLMVPGPASAMAARTTQFYQMFGGEHAAWAMIEQVAKSIAADSTVWRGSVVSALKPASMTELEFAVGVGGESVNRVLRTMLKQNKISGTAWQERAKTMFSNGLREIGDISGGVSFEFNPKFAATSWQEYQPIAARLAMMAEKRTPVVLGIMKSEAMPLELYAVLREELKNVAKVNDGFVPLDHMQTVIFDHPQLLRDEPARSYFARATTKGAPDMLPIGEIDKALNAASKEAKPLARYMHEFKTLEEREAAAGKLTRVHGYNAETGAVDPALAPGVGTATVTAMTHRVSRARAFGVKSATVDSAVQLRSTPSVKLIETNTAHALEDAGLNVERLHQGVVYSRSSGELVPSLTATLTPGASIATLRSTAVAMLETGSRKVGQQADEVVIAMSERDAVAHGLSLNGVEARWRVGRVTPEQANALGQLLVRSGLRGEYIGSTGMLRVFAMRNEIATVKELTDTLARIVPESPAAGAIKPELLRSHIEVIVNDGRNIKPLGAGEVALSDARQSISADLRYRAADRSFADRRVADELAGQSRQSQARLNRTVAAKSRAQSGDSAVVQGRVDAAWAKLEAKPTPAGVDKFLEEVANAGDPSLLPDALGVLKQAVKERMDGNPLAPALDEALLRAENDFIATGGNRGEVLFMAKMDGAAEAVLPWFDPSMRDLPPEALQKYAALQRELLSSGSPYVLKTPPIKGELAPHVYETSAGKIAQELIRPQADALKKLFSIGPVSALAKWQRMILSPRPFHATADVAKRELFNLLLNHGATVAEVNAYVDSLRAWAASSIHRFGDVPLFRSYDALPLGMYKQLAHGEEVVVNRLVDRLIGRKFVNGKPHPMFSRETLASVESAGGFGMLIDKSASGWWRGISDAARKGGVQGEVGRMLQTIYPRGFSIRHNGGKIFYHAFRFIADPRWWIMNAAESDILLGLKYGTRGRHKTPMSSLSQRYAHETEAQALSAADANLPIELMGTDASAAVALDVTGTGWYDPRRALQAKLMRTFDVESPKSMQRMLDDLPASDPIIQGLTKIVPDLPREKWGQQLFDMLDSFDKQGVKGTIDAAAKQMFDLDTYMQMNDSGILQRLHEVNQSTWNEIVRTVRGNPSRSVGEKLLNSYWLYWPISYQLKAARWLYDVATNKMFGRTTNLGGAWMLDHMLENHKRLMSQDPGYAAIWTDNPTSWFVLSMLMPITPFDIGVSLSPIPRKGLEMVHVFPERGNTPNDPISLVYAAAKFGPILTYDLLGQVAREPWFKNLFGQGEAPAPTVQLPH